MSLIIEKFKGSGPDASENVQEFGQEWQDSMDARAVKKLDFTKTAAFDPTGDHGAE